MIASLRRGRVTIVMTVSEFTETVEWLESIDPDDRATKDWRAEHDHLMPPRNEEEEEAGNA